MEADSRISIKELRVDGGATANNLLMQFQSDILNTKVIAANRNRNYCIGCSLFCRLAVGYWKMLKKFSNNGKLIKHLHRQWQMQKEMN